VLDVTFYQDSRNRLSSFFASGHVEIPETSSDEFSLVCAAVSAILQAARLGLETYAKPGLEVEQHSGRLHVRWAEASRDDDATRAIVTTAQRAIEQIARRYPAHVRLHRERDERA